MLPKQLLYLLIFGLFSFASTRYYVTEARDELWSKSSKKKYRKGRSVWEWLTFASLVRKLPRMFLVFYWTVTFIHPPAMLACLLLSACGLPAIGYWVVGVVLAVDVGIELVLFWRFPVRDHEAFRAWMDKWKRRGKRP